MVQADRVDRAPQPQDHVAPALASRRAMVEFSEQLAELGLLRVALLDADARQAIEDAELLLPQPLVDEEFGVLGEPARRLDQRGGLARPDIGRGQDDFRPLAGVHRRKPAPECA
jgi:hypothetical protein